MPGGQHGTVWCGMVVRYGSTVWYGYGYGYGMAWHDSTARHETQTRAWPPSLQRLRSSLHLRPGPVGCRPPTPPPRPAPRTFSGDRLAGHGGSGNASAMIPRPLPVRIPRAAAHHFRSRWLPGAVVPRDVAETRGSAHARGPRWRLGPVAELPAFACAAAVCRRSRRCAALLARGAVHLCTHRSACR